MTPIQELCIIQQAKEIERLYKQNATLVEALEEALPLIEASYHDMEEKHGYGSLHAETVFEGLEKVRKALAAAKGAL